MGTFLGVLIGNCCVL